LKHLAAVVALILAVGCGSPNRPTGLPAPEYQEPVVEPWSPPASSAAPSAEPAPVAAPSSAPGEVVAPSPPPAGTGGSGATLPAGTP
jgi:hypothetical protein